MRLPTSAGWRAAFLLAAVALGCPGSMLQAGEVYKSVDAQGHVVYSDRPDMSTSQTRVEIAEPNLYSDDGARTPDEPPPLRDYEQPPCPEEGYLWTPGYWAWNSAGYYWVAGDWVLPPRVGVLWTPGYWEYVERVYVFHRGYWATYVGYYGGVNYGFGYFGSGFEGGRWVGNSFAYNRSAYARSAHSQVSYHGGERGTSLAPTAQELALAREPHTAPTPLQRRTLVRAAGLPGVIPPRQGSASVATPGAGSDPAVRTYVPRGSPVQREPAHTASARTVPAATHPKTATTHGPSVRVSVPTRF